MEGVVLPLEARPSSWWASKEALFVRLACLLAYHLGTIKQEPWSRPEAQRASLAVTFPRLCSLSP